MKTLKKQKKGTVTLSRNEAKAAYHALCYYIDTRGDGRMNGDKMNIFWADLVDLATGFYNLAEDLKPNED